ncbi:xanthine dehydrogenase, molybdenum binding subunit apoprotein [Streptomyces sp. DvalAA-14]|uniref:xanthine dehydrogenase family protein molybdopterin-binding subunit n=1 Tax=unclassified Streptomyces TaxID=2593676 RepID=UPI00081AEBC8|nr:MULTISPECIES: xanthine dehydrogenase family protein molybdopterin-binding subunit [unclassified Streptomyces]MYS19539.1 molybdopterin-dependent oxidoreductase [Streptomyces sp. SID4948]SCD46892.1 xanthine dehydrogenase, molybdenum binding subunit apoprotein [Streptomyces sp. DvalAA-14]
MTAAPMKDPAGTAAARREGREKVTGAARYTAEHTPAGCAYAWPVPAAIASGRITAVHREAALAVPGALAVIAHDDAPRLRPAGDPELELLLQHDRVPHRGWYVALAVADSLEAARESAAALRVEYAPEPHDVRLSADHPGLYTPEQVSGGHPAVRERGDFGARFAAAEVRVDTTFTLPALHNHPMEPHAATARWAGDRLVVHDSDQGATAVRDALAALFGLAAEQVTVLCGHAGGGFGARGIPRPPAVLAAMAALHTGRPVKLVLPRRQSAAVTGYRPPTLQRVRIGADRKGRITALAHEVATQTSTVKEFVEHAAVPARVMYSSPHSRTAHRVVALDVPTPAWMRAPGEAPGMFALECAMDELAAAAGLDPVELRLRNEPATEPDTGRPFSSRHLAECLREGARRFGWPDRDPRPGVRRTGDLLLGTGVAAATYPVLLSPSYATAAATADGRYQVRVAAAHIGAGARTVLAQIAAAALSAPADRVRLDIGDSGPPGGSAAGGCSGTASWGSAVHKACTALAGLVREYGGQVPADGLTAGGDTEREAAAASPYARHAFGAHFAEVQVDTVTGEVRVRRMLGMFAAGHVLNARTARAQFLGGMTTGLGMALLEGTTVDPAFGDWAERDLASYHVPTCADVTGLEAHWIDESDEDLNPMGSKGIGEIGVVGSAAAIANAVHHATGTRFRQLPLTPDRVIRSVQPYQEVV